MQVTVCEVEELPPGSVHTATALGRELVLWNVDGMVVALENRCAHKDQPIHEGIVRDGVVTCPSHLWRFAVATGERIDSPGWSVPSYEVTIRDGSVLVDMPEPDPAVSIREQLLQHAREWKRDE